MQQTYSTLSKQEVFGYKQLAFSLAFFWVGGTILQKIYDSTSIFKTLNALKILIIDFI